MIKRIFAAAALLLLCQFSLADDSPVGLWKTIDDKTNKPRSIVRIVEENGEYKGIVEKGLVEGENPDRVCDKCDPPRKGQKILGMTFMWGLKKDGNEFKGGEILDPDNGKIYKAKMKLVDGGKKLDVRGFIGISLIGRTQTWLREQ
jgi:uncharacterized protein (DUF2147 family)